MKYSFVIDEKSLFRGVKNDFKKGQSPTVHTPLNQSNDMSKWHNDIYDFIKGWKSEDVDSLPCMLREKCMPNTTSQASSKIVGFYVFSKFSLDGHPFETDYSFAMYVKEETSKIITKRDGKITENTHLGRQKLHYPMSLIYLSDGYNINNADVLNKILKINGGFAYVVNGFDFDTDTKILNFNTTMVGPEGVLLSNVFIRKKGVGVKLLIDGDAIANSDLISAQTNVLSEEESSNFIKTLEKIEMSRRKSGKIGEEYVYDNIEKIFGWKIERKSHISKIYPQSPYDIECDVNGETMYIEVKSSKNSKKIFYMSNGEKRFMDKYDSNYRLVLVTNVTSSHKKTNKYQRKDIMNPKIMETEYDKIKYIVK